MFYCFTLDLGEFCLLTFPWGDLLVICYTTPEHLWIIQLCDCSLNWQKVEMWYFEQWCEWGRVFMSLGHWNNYWSKTFSNFVRKTCPKPPLPSKSNDLSQRLHAGKENPVYSLSYFLKLACSILSNNWHVPRCQASNGIFNTRLPLFHWHK